MGRGRRKETANKWINVRSCGPINCSKIHYINHSANWGKTQLGTRGFVVVFGGGGSVSGVRPVGAAINCHSSAPQPQLPARTYSLTSFCFSSPNDQLNVVAFIFPTGENASIGCVMAAIPNVHIEWEWRGRTIRNMSLMTFGRQMYLIRESSSPAGVVITGELLPTGATTGDREEAADERSGGAFDLTELVQEKHKGEQQQQHQQQQQHKLLLDSLIEGNNGGQKKQFISFLPLEPETFQSSARAPQQQPSMLRERRSAGSSTAANDDTYKRTSTLYIMNALEKDSGR